MDTSSLLQVLDIHNKFQDILYNPNRSYYYIKVEEEKLWIPILLGFTIFTSIKKNIFKLFINISEENKVIFSWINFGEDNSLSNVVASNAKPN